MFHHLKNPLNNFNKIIEIVKKNDLKYFDLPNLYHNYLLFNYQ